MNKTEYRHVVKAESGEAFVEGTRIPVVVVANTLDFGAALDSKVKELCDLYPPGYLTPSKLYSALAYAHDHQVEIQEALARDPPPGFVRDAKGNWVYKKDE